MPAKNRKSTTRQERRIHQFVYRRDGRTCWICGHPGANSIDHIRSVDDYPELRLDPGNMRPAHGEARPEYGCPGQYSRGNFPGPRRPGTTPRHQINIITGPPTAGKTTHVHQHATTGDLILDHDAIARALGAPTAHGRHTPHDRAARIARTAITEDILTAKNPPTTWIIHSAPTPAQITRYQAAGATNTLLDPGPRTCIARAKNERERWTVHAIIDWYKRDADRLRQWAAKEAPPSTRGRQW